MVLIESGQLLIQIMILFETDTFMEKLLIQVIIILQRQLIIRGLVELLDTMIQEYLKTSIAYQKLILIYILILS